MRIINFIPDHLQNFFTTWSILRVDFQELRNDITQLLRILVGNSRIHPLKILRKRKTTLMWLCWRGLPCHQPWRAVWERTFRKPHTLNSKCRSCYRTASLSTLQDSRNKECQSKSLKVLSSLVLTHSYHPISLLFSFFIFSSKNIYFFIYFLFKLEYLKY
jgi:hypothetical protein